MSNPGSWLPWLTPLGVTALLIWIPRELWRRMRERLVNRLDHEIGLRATRFPRLYREHVMRDLRFPDLKGLATLGPCYPELDDVFVDVSLAHSAPHQVAEGILPLLGEPNERRSLSEFLGHPEPIVIAVLGAPGSGKTTLARYTARRTAQNHRKARRSVPILLYLRDHTQAIVDNPAVTLPELVRQQLGALANKEPHGWLEKRLQNGDCLNLFDGLDEVAHAADRSKVAAWVEQQTKHHAKNDFVITSRPQGYRTNPVDGASVLQVRGFTYEQVKTFVHGWYRATVMSNNGKYDADFQSQADRDSEDLLERLETAPELNDLTVNPLLLTMIANVHMFRGALPGSRVELYSEICQVMLGRRQEAKRLVLNLNAERKMRLLGHLALTMMHERNRDISNTLALTVIGKHLPRMSDTVTADDVLADACSNGLVIEREAGIYSFAHLTFQEYLAAATIRDSGDSAVLCDTVDDVWWRETALLYAARSSGDSIVSACLESGGVNALTLAFDIAEEGDLAPRLRRSLETVLNAHDDDPARRRLRNGILTSRAIRQSLFRTKSGSRVCATPVSVETYHYYLFDRVQPARTTNCSTASSPMTGVYATDAIAFVNWLNDVTENQPGYRLTTPDEIGELRSHVTSLDFAPYTVWTQPESSRPTLWTPKPDEHPNRVAWDTVDEHLAEDIIRLIPSLLYVSLLERRKHPTEPIRGRAQSFARALARELDVNNILRRSITRKDVLPTAAPRVAVHASELLWAVDLVESLKTAVLHRPHLDNAIALARQLTRRLYADRDIGQFVSTADDEEHNALELALQPVLFAYLSTGETPNQWWPHESFANELVSRVSMSSFSEVIELGMLEGTLHTAISAVRNLAPRQYLRGSSTDLVADKFEHAAYNVFSRQLQITEGLATFLRVTALCFGALARQHDDATTHRKFCEIAAGVTLLERRRTGESPTTETIMLAMV